ncbi:MAG: hypothetical protein JO142_05240, partial [Burkholderiales bacterium]|nr:hypothetical protein [Burkholderiales bacterium]
MKSKQIFALGTIAAAALALVACGKQESPPATTAAPAAPAAEQVTTV